MANPFTGIITAEFKQIFDDAINALLENTALTVPCTLIFDNTKLQDCPNCIYDSISRKSSNIYEVGGPIPFITGQICPYCNGIGSLSFSSEEQVYLGIIKPVFFGGSNLDLESVNFVDGKIQSLSNIDLYAKLKNASSVIVDTNIINLTNSKYIRYKDPVPVGFGNNSFIITTWQGVQ
jgi:hypothetical protein